MESACTTVDMASLQRSLPEEAPGIEATVNADNLVLGPHLYPSSLACENSMDLALHGFEASRKVVFKLKGIECCACASSIEKAIKHLPGIHDASVATLHNTAQVVYGPAFIDKNTIQKAIQDSGFDVTAVEEEPECQSITCRLRVKGMTCTACSSSLESQLKQIEGVLKAVVALAIEEAEVQYDPALVNYKQIIKVIADTGFEAELISAGNESSRIHLRLENSMIYSKENMQLMQCSLMELAGVKAVEIDAREKRIIISYDPSETGPRCFIDTINNAGFKASVHADLSGPDRSKDVKDYKHHFLWSCAFTIPIFLFAMVFMYIPILKDTLEKKVVNMLTVGMLVRWALSTPVQFGFGKRFYRGAYNALRHGSANMDVLIALGTNAAYFYSVYTVLRATTSSKGFKESDFFETSAMLISFILLGKYLEALAKGKTSEAISKLIELQPECATLLIRDHNGEILSEEVISSQLIQKKDVLKIVPGKKVPTDGVVVWGQSHVNESMITGEARPVPKHPGDKIIGGTVNESGVLHVQATRVGSETALSQIVRLVKAAQMAKAPVQKYADRISEYFVPFVVLSAVVTWLAWFGAGICGSYPKSWIPTYMDEFELALQFGISVLVIACPCALGLATPTAVMVATGKGASQGILIKSGQALESTHKIRCIVFDKTGTLTYGRPVVTHTKLFKSLPIADFYKLVAAVEVNSVHPLARAIVQHANSLEAEAPQGSGCPLVEDFESIPGRGVRARVEDKEVLIGNRKLMEGLTVTLSAEVAQHLKHMEDMAETAVIVSSEHDIVGIIAVSDSVRPEAAGAIALLQSWGVQSVMVTGDNWGTAQAVARELGIDNFIAEAEPSTKADKITDLQRTGMVVGVVGDGINDSPALVAADVGMAIGAGTDVAIEAADIVLMRSNLEDVLTAIDLSKKTFSKIKMNYVWALGYNVLALPLAAGVLFPFIRLRLPPWVAGAAMAISSLSVVCSSLLLRSYKRPKRLASLKVLSKASTRMLAKKEKG